MRFPLFFAIFSCALSAQCSGDPLHRVIRSVTELADEPQAGNAGLIAQVAGIASGHFGNSQRFVQNIFAGFREEQVDVISAQYARLSPLFLQYAKLLLI